MARAAAIGVLGIAVLITVMLATLFIGMRRNDAAINAHLGTATATVLTVGVLRTGIEFVTADGTTVRPPDGVLYPGMLSPGQRFLVEYSTEQPDLVRVAGRTAAVGNLLIAIVFVVTWLLAAPLTLWLRHRSGGSLLRRMRRRTISDGVGAQPVDLG